MLSTFTISHCPNCGSQAIEKVRRDLTRTYRGRSYTVPALSYYLCPACGEEVFDHAAMQKIEACSPAYGARRRQAAITR